jgi:hypothetical protein
MKKNVLSILYGECTSSVEESIKNNVRKSLGDSLWDHFCKTKQPGPNDWIDVKTWNSIGLSLGRSLHDSVRVMIQINF